MNTTKIYNAQLNVSSQYNLETINDLISKLSFYFDDVYYNYETKSIDIETSDVDNNDINVIKREMVDWLSKLPVDEESIETVCDNINFIYNITKLSYNELENKRIIKLYLY